MLADAAITRVNGACYSGDPFRNGSATGTVYRTLLLRVLPGTDIDTVARFEEELRLMPRYVNTITAWQLSRVEEPVGTSAWTHVFEQEFTDVDGLMGALPDAPDPLGGGGPMVRSRVPGRDHPRSRMPQLLRTGLADPALAIPREQTQSTLTPRIMALLRLLGRQPLQSRGQDVRVGRRGRLQRRQDPRPVEAVHRESLRPRIVQAERHQTGALGGG